MRFKAALVVTAAMSMFTVAVDAETIDPAQAIAQKFSEASDPKPAVAEPAVAEPTAPERSFASPGVDYEADMLARARAEELQRHQDAAQQLVTIPPSPQSPPPTPAAPAVAPEPPSPPLAKIAALPPKPAPEPPVARPETTGPTVSTAAVLLVLDPDVSGLDIKPDPIICIDNSCWLSNGIISPAREMPRNEAVALGGTDNLTSDSCSGKSGCVYRNVTINPNSRIDVIEVGEGGGASAGAFTIPVDKTCHKESSSLVCDNGVTTQNFRIWVVPEATAAAAGPPSLENALAEGLPETDETSSNDK